MTARELVRISGLAKNFGPARILSDFHLNVNVGEIVMLVGPSGAGYSPLLRRINRLEDPSGGDIIVYVAVLVSTVLHGKRAPG